MTKLDHTEPKNTLVALYLVLSTFFVFFIVVVVYFYFISVAQHENHVKIEQAPTEQLDSLRAAETELLGQDIQGNPKDTYAAVDAGKGIYRIPIERAMELEAQEPWRRSMPAVTQPSATPIPAPASNDHATTSTS